MVAGFSLQGRSWVVSLLPLTQGFLGVTQPGLKCSMEKWLNALEPDARFRSWLCRVVLDK